MSKVQIGTVGEIQGKEQKLVEKITGIQQGRKAEFWNG
jgi:hypothetical protein